MNHNIALIGFMGTGKSSAGKLLAERLGREFVETDDLVEKRAGKPIKAIFYEDGERTFRRMESDVIRDVSSSEGMVISCGGGALLDEGNVAALKKSSVFILLTATPKTMLERTGGQDQRPLLEGPERIARFEEMVAERMGTYFSAADYCIDTTGSSVEDVVEAIIGKVVG